MIESRVLSLECACRVHVVSGFGRHVVSTDRASAGRSSLLFARMISHALFSSAFCSRSPEIDPMEAGRQVRAPTYSIILSVLLAISLSISSNFASFSTIPVSEFLALRGACDPRVSDSTRSDGNTKSRMLADTMSRADVTRVAYLTSRNDHIGLPSTTPLSSTTTISTTAATTTGQTNSPLRGRHGPVGM